METKALNTFAELPATYEGLCSLLLPRPIRDEISYRNSVEMVDALAGHELNRDQSDYLVALAHHLEDWENQHSEPLCMVTASDAVRYLLESNELSARDLAELLGLSDSAAYRILKGTRSLTVEHIRALCERFRVDPRLFLQVP